MRARLRLVLGGVDHEEVGEIPGEGWLLTPVVQASIGSNIRLRGPSFPLPAVPDNDHGKVSRFLLEGVEPLQGSSTHHHLNRLVGHDRLVIG